MSDLLSKMQSAYSSEEEDSSDSPKPVPAS